MIRPRSFSSFAAAGSGSERSSRSAFQQRGNVAEDVRRLYQYYLYHSQPELRELIVRVKEIFTKYEENQVVHPILASDSPLASDLSFLPLSDEYNDVFSTILSFTLKIASLYEKFPEVAEKAASKYKK